MFTMGCRVETGFEDKRDDADSPPDFTEIRDWIFSRRIMS